jgi:hypothetical protein
VVTVAHGVGECLALGHESEARFLFSIVSGLLGAELVLIVDEIVETFPEVVEGLLLGRALAGKLVVAADLARRPLLYDSLDLGLGGLSL